MGWLLLHPNATVLLSTNVDSGLLSLTIDSADFNQEREKNPLLTLNIVCHSSTASWTFSPQAQVVSSESLSKHIFFLSTKKVRREKTEQAIIVGSLRVIHIRCECGYGFGCLGFE